MENFIPQPRKLAFDDEGERAFVSSPGLNPIVIDRRTIPFLKQMNGHLSLKEVFTFLVRQKETVFIGSSIRTLADMARQGYLVNGAEFLRTYNPDNQHQNKSLSHFKALDRSYFSQERLIGLLQKTTLFMQCDRKTAKKILKHSSLEYVYEKTSIIKKGTKSQDFYILLAGEVGVFQDNEWIATLSPLNIFGESAAIFERERNADVETLTPCWLLKVDASQLVDRKAIESFDLFASLKSRLLLNQTLAANPLFKKVPSDILQLFLSNCRLEKHGKEREIISQGETGGRFLFCP